jgi:hypothetical protein
MPPSEPSSCARALGRGRAALLWGAAAFLLAQMGLWLALDADWTLRDPEYGQHLGRLRQRLEARGRARPPLVFLGSSRVAMGFRPGLLPANGPGARGEPVVFNFGLLQSGPVMELLCLRRLLADGIRPDCVFVEVWLWILPASARSQTAVFGPQRFGRGDLRALRRYGAEPPQEERGWPEELVPSLSYRALLRNHFAPGWFGPENPQDKAWEDVDAWGWLGLPPHAASRTGDRAFMEGMRKSYTGQANEFTAGDDSRRAFADLFRLCRQEKITAVVVAMPDGFLADYDPAANARMDDFLRELSREHGTPLVDAREWAALDEFVEGIHLTHQGAARFTKRFGREVIRPYLDGEPLARRWPPGQLAQTSSESSPPKAE